MGADMYSAVAWQLLLAVVTAIFVHRWYTGTRSKSSTSKPPTSGSASKQTGGVERTLGDWKPVSFTYPKFAPCMDELLSIKPPPYRPFRWGNYNVTMGIRSMHFDDWIEIDNQFAHYHRISAHRIATRGDLAVRTLPASPGIPSGAPAARELVYELSEYLSRRYPLTFRASRHAHKEGDYGWYGEGQIKEIEILPLEAKYNLDEEDPMKVCAMLVQDDLALMVEGSDGRYYFQAGAICAPGFWRMEDKLGLPLEEIHLRGEVPQYKEKLQTSLGRFFLKLPVDKPVLRNNYFFQIIDPALAENKDEIDPDELAWSYTTNGDEDLFNQATKEPHPDLLQSASATSEPGVAGGKERAKFVPPAPTTSAELVRFRTERQSLRRLPRSGAIVFTIRTYISPITELVREAGVPGRMASAIRSWPEDVQMYKGQHLYRDAILPYLDEWHAKQMEAGVVDRTSRYPY